MPSGLENATRRIQNQKREEKIQVLEEKGIDPFAPDPNILSQGYSAVIGPSYSAASSGVLLGYTKQEGDKTYSYTPSLELNGIKQQIDNYTYKYEPDGSGGFYLSQMYAPNAPGASFNKEGVKVADLARSDGGGGGAMFKEALFMAGSLLLPFAAPALTAAIGSIVAPTAAAGTQAIIGNAVIGGALSEAQGGDFLDGALKAGANAVVGNVIRPELVTATGSNALASAVTSGAISEISGGDFLQGAIQGGISGLAQDAKLALADQYIDAVEPGIGYDPSTSPTELDVIDAYPELAPAPVIDTSFSPDYSLSTSAPVIPDMGGQGIQVPTINEIIDVVNQNIDYSLPIPDSGLGLVMPTAPNLDSMGGGQGLVIPVDGGVISESGFIPDAYVPDLGDPESFINQPAPNVDVEIPELTDELPEDISGKLSQVDLIKTLASLVAANLASNSSSESTAQEESSGYPIQPIPSEWKSSAYNMAFTPSAPIDFGSPELLQGTQWANPSVQPTQMDYSLSDVINTLNYQSVPFVQQQYNQPAFAGFANQPTSNVGLNDIIGGLNGQQVSIADIISSIQGQYGQETTS